MLEGLEANEVLLSEMCLAARLDSGFAAFPERHYLEKILNRKKIKPISSISRYISSGHTPYLHNVKEGDVDFVTVECISDLMLHKDKLKKISTKQFEEEFEINRLQIGSVLCTIKRRICKAFPITKDYGDAAFNQDIAFIVPTHEVSAVYLATYLCSKVGQLFAKRQMTEQINPYISVENLSALPVVIASKNFQIKIDLIFEQADKCRARSKFEYGSAEVLLLDTLGITDFSPSTEAVSIKSFNNSFGVTGRLDAEYYQPKFDELEAKIAETHELCLLGRLLTLNQRGTQPDYEEEGLPVVNSKHVREGGVILSGNRFANLSNKENPLFIQNGDVLINGTGVGTIGRSAPYLHEQNAIPDNHVTILRTDKLNPIFLSVYLNSIAGKYQVDKYFKGSSGQIELYPKDIDCFYVPLVDVAIQTEIAALVQRSFTLKAESERLLEVAKRAVEIAIEQDEKTALDFIARGRQGGSHE